MISRVFLLAAPGEADQRPGQGKQGKSRKFRQRLKQTVGAEMTLVTGLDALWVDYEMKSNCTKHRGSKEEEWSD